MSDDTLRVEVVAADRLVWSGQATMVIARTTEGDVGILPNHAPLLSSIIEGVVDVQTAEGEYDHVAEQAFFMCGGLDDVERRWDEIQKSL